MLRDANAGSDDLPPSVSSLLFFFFRLGIDKACGAASQHRLAQRQRTLSLQSGLALPGGFALIAL